MIRKSDIWEVFTNTPQIKNALPLEMHKINEVCNLDILEKPADI